jgi:hypothetical protein
LTEIVAAFQSADGDINNAITNLADAATVAVDNEASIRLAADEQLTSDLSAEVSNRIADVGAEESRATSAEASLDAAKLNLAGGTMLGSIDMGNNNIEDVSTIYTWQINAADEEWGYVTLGSKLNANGKSIEYLPAPTGDSHATNKLYVDNAVSAEVSRAEFVEANIYQSITNEVSRATEAEGSIAIQLSSEVSYIIANTDLTSIDSFAEVVADMSSEISRAESAEASIALDFANIYAKHVAVNETPDGTAVAFTIATPVREGSELIYMNGLLLDAGDYTPDMVEGKVAGFTFINAPLAGDKVRAYGVC